MIYGVQRAPRRDRALRPARAAASPTSISICCARSGFGGARSTTTRAPAARTGAFRRIPFTLDPPRRISACVTKVDRFPFVPDEGGSGSRSTATNDTTSRSPGSSGACAASAAHDRHRRLRWSRLHARSSSPPRRGPPQPPRTDTILAFGRCRFRNSAPRTTRPPSRPRRHLRDPRHRPAARMLTRWATRSAGAGGL